MAKKRKKKSKRKVKSIPSFSSLVELEEFIKNNKVSKKDLEKALDRIRYIEYEIQNMIYEGGPPRDDD